MSGPDAILQLRNITKSYPGVIALRDVTLDIARNEVHALVGENGAGKSTLIKTCTGAVIPDSGTISVGGTEFGFMTPKRSAANGIAAIYQEPNLVGGLSAAENIFLGKAIRKGIVIDRKEMAERSRAIFSQLGVDINPNELVKNLAVGHRQIVEIAKAISQNARLLIMDEPSSPLTIAEVGRLFNLVGKLKAAGVTIIYVSHRMDEIFQLADRITVMRDGRKIETVNTRDTDVTQLVRLMVGRELKETYPARKAAIPDEPLLSVQHLSGNGLSDISFTIGRGEVLGFAGLIGAGRTELAELLFGIKPKTAGTVIFKGREIAPRTPRDAIDLGIALVPEDRQRQGALMSIDIKGNICMGILKRISFGSVVSRRKERGIAQRYSEELRIKTPGLEQRVGNLSGGNQQKVVLAKGLAAEPELIILDEPTRGIDVGAKQEIYTLIRALTESGKAVLMISSELEELLGLSDRIVVLSEGSMTGVVNKADFSQEVIMSYASNAGGRGAVHEGC
jgi:ribose transport system ATP-binding protein